MTLEQLDLLGGPAVPLPAPDANTQAGRIFAHLQRLGSITQLEALDLYHCMRLAPIVHRLRQAGWHIETQTEESSTGARYARYWLRT